jgi:hypothetical protein
MKHLLVILTLLPTLLFSQNIGIEVNNISKVQKIEDRDITFGVKEIVEELMLDEGFTINTKEEPNKIVKVTIYKVESPHQILNIMGTKWLKKSYEVEVRIVLDNVTYEGKGKRNTFLFAAFLDVENNEVPLNRKAFSKALQSALKQTIKTIK